MRLRKLLLTLSVVLAGCAGVGSHDQAIPEARKPFKYEWPFIYFRFLGPSLNEDVVASMHDQENATELVEAIVFFKKTTDVLVDFVGNADATECAEVDCMELSIRRAQYVLDYLRSNGVPGDRLGKAYGMAASRPFAFSSKDGGGRFNRRVEFVIHTTSVKEARRSSE